MLLTCSQFRRNAPVRRGLVRGPYKLFSASARRFVVVLCHLHLSGLGMHLDSRLFRDALRTAMCGDVQSSCAHYSKGDLTSPCYALLRDLPHGTPCLSDSLQDVRRLHRFVAGRQMYHQLSQDINAHTASQDRRTELTALRVRKGGKGQPGRSAGHFLDIWLSPRRSPTDFGGPSWENQVGMPSDHHRRVIESAPASPPAVPFPPFELPNRSSI